MLIGTQQESTWTESKLQKQLLIWCHQALWNLHNAAALDNEAHQVATLLGRLTHRHEKGWNSFWLGLFNALRGAHVEALLASVEEMQLIGSLLIGVLRCAEFPQQQFTTSSETKAQQQPY